MAKKIFKIALSGYDAQSDTNPDHFSLYVDQTTDYVLIKEKERGVRSVANNAIIEVTHGLGYIPYVIAFLDNGDGSYTRLFGMDQGSVTGEAGFKVDTTKLYLVNVSGSTKNILYYIFYDNVDSDDSSLSVEFTNPVVSVAKIGKSAFSKNPNDTVLRTDLNTFKIIKEGTKDATVVATTQNQTFTQAHGLGYAPLVNAFYIVNGGSVVYPVERIKSDNVNITFTFNGGYSDSSIHIRYFCLESL